MKRNIIANMMDRKNIATIIPPWVEKATETPDISVCEFLLKNC